MAESHYIYAEVPAAGPNRPLIFAFHGTGGDETQFVPLAQRVWSGSAIISAMPDRPADEGTAARARRRADAALSACGADPAVADDDHAPVLIARRRLFARGAGLGTGRRADALAELGERRDREHRDRDRAHEGRRERPVDEPAGPLVGCLGAPVQRRHPV